MFRHRTLTIGAWHTLILSLVFLLAGIVMLVVMNHAMKQEALRDARDKARIILDRNLSTHQYFTSELKPSVFRLTDPFRPKEYFDPAWMSSTYAVRQIDRHFKNLNSADYYYKECAINARNPENEADGFERGFIERINRDPGLTEQDEVRTIEGKPFYVILRRGEVLEENCMRCHSTPGKAPEAMVSRYGPERSFYRSVGETVSAISIRVPLDAAYKNTERLSLLLSLLWVCVLGAVFLVLMATDRRLIFAPLGRIRQKAMQIASDERHLGDTIDAPSGKELCELTSAFNVMSASLRKSREQLEDKVQERTAELQAALDNVKKLSGMLPICSSCKKIRDDEGYWKQIEVYIRDHSDAQFSHGICPECAVKLYPEYYERKEGR